MYQGQGIKLRVSGLGSDAPWRIHLEHESGAALIAPGCEPTGSRVSVVGFDGTTFEFDLQDTSAEVTASQPTPLLGGSTQASVPRGPDPEPGPVRVTGDEHTMPIVVKS